MEPLRNKLYVSTPAPDDDFGSAGEASGLTAKQEKFCLALADTGNQAAAYRIAYTVHERTMPNVVWVNASRLASLPKVRKRVAELRQQLVLETIMSVREAFAWQVDIATADPNEIAYVAKRPCRYCYGVSHQYQWRDEDEFAAALAKALDEDKKVPSDAGGFGFTQLKDPALTCPVCLGEGTPENIINDTRNLSGKARKLYKGIDIKNGALVVTMHDQAKAWEMALRMLGAFNDKLDLRTPAERQGATKIPDGLNEQDTTRAYLAMLS